MTRILFVCTGNTCRSPMAESMLRHLAHERGLDVEVRSAGVSAWGDAPMSEHARSVLEKWKMSNEAFHSQGLASSTVAWADLILTLTLGHKQHVLQRYPQAADKVYTLKEYVSTDEGALMAQEQMHALIAELQLKLAMGEQPTPEEMRLLNQLQQQAPGTDIADPYGGSLEQYVQTAEDIKESLQLLLDKLIKK
ncbi:low molecular weight protein arginine phosphatase [Paenibacillus sp. UMB4589-SE434]|uniref:low molecular weight protein arginine phosphatase n=1 Tax=Paenibacillus sp. UMB4589-SE434 TaxID=3046314 RepID=UPI00254C1C90|nr:low molecular weight protein arginine phosphatase [Paenibacillus sp. UMB4589-SE434]MDK8181566.1 low molecular weight protein arginine phosphatase [Paenibacillus sp. UMB4589-SE434]